MNKVPYSPQWGHAALYMERPSIYDGLIFVLLIRFVQKHSLTDWSSSYTEQPCWQRGPRTWWSRWAAETSFRTTTNLGFKADWLNRSRIWKLFECLLKLWGTRFADLIKPKLNSLKQPRAKKRIVRYLSSGKLSPINISHFTITHYQACKCEPIS